MFNNPPPAKKESFDWLKKIYGTLGGDDKKYSRDIIYSALLRLVSDEHNDSFYDRIFLKNSYGQLFSVC